jgi:hypothetical protein
MPRHYAGPVLIGTHQWLKGHFQGVAIGADAAEEARAIAFMACGSHLLDLDQEAILIAVYIDFLYVLGVARGFSFDPILLTRTAPESYSACLDSASYRLLVHISDHQDVAIVHILNHGGYQPVGIELQPGWNLHWRILSSCGSGAGIQGFRLAGRMSHSYRIHVNYEDYLNTRIPEHH